MTEHLDRMAHLRADPAALAAEAARSDALATPVWRGRSLVEEVDGGLRGAWRPLAELRRLHPDGLEIYLGRDRAGRPRFAVDLGDRDDPAAQGLGGRFTDLRRGGLTLSAEEFEPLAYAKGMAHWHRSSPHCERCGSAEVRVLAGGFERRCGDCDAVGYPRSDPAVMMLPVLGDRCLLARQDRFPPGMYSALAGFVEPGESLEDCVVRETWEEARLKVTRTVYFGSQPWPFPRSLMVGFFALVEADRFELEQDELEDARWVSRDTLRDPQGFFVPPPRSLAHHLIGAFADGLARLD